MHRVLAIVCAFILMMSGCSDINHISDHGMALRQSIAEGCFFQANVVADFSDKTYSFSMNCIADQRGAMEFEVASPESIAGICGNVSATGGKLTFDDAVLAFPLLADGEISPVCAPWLCVRALMGGYFRSSADEGDRVRLTIDDSFSGEELMIDVWVLKTGTPEYAEILWNGRKLISVRFENFSVL